MKSTPTLHRALLPIYLLLSCLIHSGNSQSSPSSQSSYQSAQSNNQTSNQYEQKNLTGLAILSNVNFVVDDDGNITSGVLYDVFQSVWGNNNISVTYDTLKYSSKTTELTTVLEEISNSTYDFAVGYPIISYSDDDDDSDATYKQYGVTKLDIITDSAIVYTPNILQLLVGNVLQEMFFVVGIVLLPWFLVNTLFFYLIELRKFSKTDFFRGFFEAFMTITFRHQIMSATAKVYSTVFYFITAIIGMLLLGDFIYVIASMILSLDTSGSSQTVSSQSTTCIVQDDLLVSSFMDAREEIPRCVATDVHGCLVQLSSLNIGSFMVSKSYMMNYLYNNPHQNNQFNFYSRDSILLTYSIFIRSKLSISDSISRTLLSLRPQFYQRIYKNYYITPVYNRIAPTSIFSNSILLIFMSLTITSLFFILFLIVLIYRHIKRKAAKNPKDSDEFMKQDSLKRNEIIKKHSKNKKVRISELEDTENTDLNYNSPSLPDHQPLQRQLLKQRPPMRLGSSPMKDATLSLSGSLQLNKFDGKPEKSWSELQSLDYNKKESGEAIRRGEQNQQHSINIEMQRNQPNRLGQKERVEHGSEDDDDYGRKTR